MEFYVKIKKLSSMVRQAVCIFLCLFIPCLVMAITAEYDSERGDAFISVYSLSPVTSILLWLLVFSFVAMFVLNYKKDKLLLRIIYISNAAAVYVMVIANSFLSVGTVSLEAALSVLGLTLVAAIYSITISLFEIFRNKPYFE